MLKVKKLGKKMLNKLLRDILLWKKFIIRFVNQLKPFKNMMYFFHIVFNGMWKTEK